MGIRNTRFNFDMNLLQMQAEVYPEAKLPQSLDLSDQPDCPRKVVIKEVESGEIRLEVGADGTFLLFDCECTDALPYCKAQCCGLVGTIVFQDELDDKLLPVELDGESLVLTRDADGFCSCLDRRTRLCGIYPDRPRTCQNFHCTRGAHQRGWKLANRVHRQSML